ncbi:ATP-dependent nuclease [Leptospira sp. SA-E8]|uniref:ATP-dependent nuclease n=1 Tax=Leptospira sp. SA-E8 TaxID=3422259 RepID=UPI003EB7A613
MINYLKAKNHKGITQILLENIGILNVICGRNNSGKTSILEALCEKDHYSVGYLLESVEWPTKLFQRIANGYSSPSPQSLINWFNRAIKREVEEGLVWYTDNKEEINARFASDQKIDNYLRGYSPVNIKEVIEPILNKIESNYRPILIPAKRSLQFKVVINFKEELKPNGDGVVNRLFFLKNQDLETDDYKRYLKIYDSFKEITGVIFNIIPDTDNRITLFFKINNKWLNSNDCGLGFSDLLIIIAVLVDMDYSFLLIEEPENHLHADIQRRFLNLLRLYKDKQFIITTHSSVFLDTQYVNKIFHILNENGVISASDQTSKSEIINALGYSVADNLVADVLILTEGPTDIIFIKKILDWLMPTKLFNIRYWPLGGDIMSSLDLSVVAERNNVFALIDNDPGSSVQRTRFQKECEKFQIGCTRLSRYSIENYLSLDAIKKIFPEQLYDNIKSIEPNIKVDKQLKFDSASGSIKGKMQKILDEMQLDDIKGTDLLEFAQSIVKYLTRESE